MPWEFWRLTPREFVLKIDGLHRRDDRAWHRVAALGLWILAPWAGKKVLTIEKLLGNRRLTIWPKTR